MRILLFTTAYKPYIGGSELAIEAIMRHLPSIEFDVLTPRYSRRLPIFEKQDNVSIYRVGVGTVFDKYIFPIAGFFKALRMFKKYKYTVIHAYQASYGALAGTFTRIFTQTPLLLTLQEGKELRSQSWPVRFIRWLIIQRVDAFTAISEHLRKYIFSQYPGAIVRLIPNGVEYNSFADPDIRAHGDMRAKLGLKADQFVLMTVSRLVPKNGIAMLIRALRIIRLKLPAILVVVGAGPLRKTLEDLARDIGMKEHVIFAGSVSHHQIPKYLGIADVFIRPSLSEGMGSAFLEAMAAGAPVVGTRVGGIIDFLEHGRTGLLCDGTEPESIARQVVDLLEQPVLRKNIIQNAQTLVQNKYDWGIIAGLMNDLYVSIAKS